MVGRLGVAAGLTLRGSITCLLDLVGGWSDFQVIDFSVSVCDPPLPSDWACEI